MTPKSGGRFLTFVEQQAWDEYESVLGQYHKVYKVRHYDRVSVHDAFPEIKTAFDKCCKLSAEVRNLIETRFKEVE